MLTKEFVETTGFKNMKSNSAISLMNRVIPNGNVGQRRSRPVFVGLRTLCRMVMGVLMGSASVKGESLQWQNTVLEVSANPRDEKVSAIFVFSNFGPSPVAIESVRPGCDCTIAEFDKGTIMPGESGKILVTFTIGDRVGLQIKTITVNTDGNPGEVTILTLRVNIPELVEIHPRLLVWPIGSDLSEKAVDVFLATDPLITVTGATATDPAFVTRLETLKANRQYRVWLKPTSTLTRARSTIAVQTRAVTGETAQAFNIYAQVK
jgi:hypothetical protein